MKFSFRNRRSFGQLAALIFLTAVLTLFLGAVGNGRASINEGSEIYLPIIHSNSRLAPVPELTASISLGDAQCPHDMAYNQFSGLLYVTNEDSHDISIIRDNKFDRHIATGKWPKFVVSDPYSDKVYLTHVWDGIRVLHGTNITANIPEYVESYWPVINSINGYTYVTDLGEVVTIIRDDKRVIDVKPPDFEGERVEWQLAADYDTVTGLTYFASWQHGIMTVLDGLDIVNQFSFEGEGATDMAIDSHRKLAVIANNRARADKDSPNNISIVNLNNKNITEIFSGKLSQHVALDPVTGYAYVTNPENDSVTVLQGTREVATYETGNRPWAVAVDSVTGLAYISNADDNSVSVFRDGIPVTTIELPDDMGFEPHHVTIDEASGRVFILNRSSKENPTYPDTQVTICEEPWVHILQ